MTWFRYTKNCCPECGQPLKLSRCGVYLTPAKLKIFDYIRLNPNKSKNELAEAIYPSVPAEQAKKTIGSSITQINEMLIEANVSIVGPRLGSDGYQVKGLKHGNGKRR